MFYGSLSSLIILSQDGIIWILTTKIMKMIPQPQEPRLPFHAEARWADSSLVGTEQISPGRLAATFLHGHLLIGKPMVTIPGFV